MRYVAQFIVGAMLAWITLSCAHYPRYQNHLPLNTKEFTDASGTYERWWKHAERCTGKRVPFRGVRMYLVVGSHDGFPYAGNVLAGLAYAQRGAVVLSTDALFDSAVVIHEFVHLQASPEGHDPEYFQRRCAKVVVCNGHCLTDTLHPTGRWP